MAMFGYMTEIETVDMVEALTVQAQGEVEHIQL